MTTRAADGAADPERERQQGMSRAEAAAAHFVRDLRSIRELGQGNINATYLVQTGSRSLVLQRINPAVFADPFAVVRNFVRITEYLTRENSRSGGTFLVPSLITTSDGRSCWEDREGGLWRAQSAIDGTAMSVLTGRSQAVAIGRCLGWFHRLTADIDCGDFEIPLPGFHVLPQYLAEYDRVLNESDRQWSPAEQRCLAAVEEMRTRAPLFQRLCGEGRLRLRIVHGDPKVENFLFDSAGRIVSLIDLDTVGPGLLHHDLGDCLRSCCNVRGESGDAAAISFNLGSCRAFFEGYAAEMGGLLGGDDRRLIFDALLLITFELGLRFFTDHLRGDSYFRVRHRGENLERAETQFALLESIGEQEADIREVFSAE